MESKILYVGLIVIIVGIGVLAYFDYNTYNEKQLQTYMIQAEYYNNTAINLNNSLGEALNKTDYNTAINIEHSMLNDFQQAVNNDNNAIKYASGPRKDYITYDIMRLNYDIKLENDGIQTFTALQNGDLSSALGKVNDLKDDSQHTEDYRNKEDEILIANQDQFKFLNN